MEGWEKLKVAAGAASAVIIPIVLLVVGNNYSAAIKERELEGQFVGLAVAILTEEPTGETENLRRWATDVINAYSGVELPAETRQELIKSLRLASQPGVIVPRTPATEAFTDFGVFVCGDAWDDAAAQQTAIELIGILEGMSRRGRVTFNQWSGGLYDEIGADELRGRLTIVVDRDHPEQVEVQRLRARLGERLDATTFQVLDNRGAETPWLISLIVCP